MSIAVIGPLCRDEIHINGKVYKQIGSIPYYVGKALQVFGCDTKLYISCAGEDDKRAKEYLQGIDFLHIPSQETITVDLNYHEDSNKRTQRIHYVPYTIAYKDLDKDIELCDTIIFGPLFYYDIDPKLFEQLSHKRIVLGNFGMFTYAEGGFMVKKHPERVRDLLPYIDTLFLDEEEIIFLTGKDTLEEAIHYAHQYVRIVVVTRGSQGSIIMYEGKKYHIPSYPPSKIVDLTGAGDTYLAAFLVKEQESSDYAVIGRFAAMAATCKIAWKGPLTMEKQKIEDTLKNYSL